MTDPLFRTRLARRACLIATPALVVPGLVTGCGSQDAGDQTVTSTSTSTATATATATTTTTTTTSTGTATATTTTTTTSTSTATTTSTSTTDDEGESQSDGVTIGAAYTKDPHDFGVVPVGSSSRLLVEVTVAYGTSAEITNASASGEYFAVSDTSTCDGVTLTFGHPCTVEVVYHPEKAGEHAGELILSVQIGEPTDDSSTADPSASQTSTSTASSTSTPTPSSSGTNAIPSGQPGNSSVAARGADTGPTSVRLALRGTAE